MSIQLYSHSKHDLEKAVEIILQKAKNVFSIQDSQIQTAENDLVSQTEAAEFLKISIPTIIDWRKNKNLPYYNFNGRYYYSRSELLEYGRNRNSRVK
ncbi:helix-turn-helix domain-containing protein [Chryseobacterium arthrosphaerae]|uniref:helix-turn-helix domain-containing protein n=1 Tax=Chryseobacterium arthrosphaerae TaxID=651561 RepID=UPI0023E2CE3C|nr:helix-turn-helix domain-containing protein [Chryseobacterium arthrosphaerae]WES97713.1 helix-turn-helix domain-containing protein [Chryseobacterium arthrosphaerae]